jgi:hypothetical protein
LGTVKKNNEISVCYGTDAKYLPTAGFVDLDNLSFIVKRMPK